MTDRRRLARAIFLWAQRHPEEEREAFVRRRCGDDTELCEQVLRRLAKAESSKGLFDPPSSVANVFGNPNLEPGQKLGQL